jgi:hypothetical protein
MNEQDELKLYMEILHGINEFIRKLRYYADIELEASKEGHSWNDDQMMAVKGRIRLKRRIADELEEIMKGKPKS